MTSNPISPWQIGGETVETVRDFIFLGSRITGDGDCSHEIKRRLLLGRKTMTNLDSILKSRGITLPTKIRLVKSLIFPVVMYGCESWIIKKAAAAAPLQSCPTLCNPTDGSPPGSAIPGILQARTLQWVAISFSSEWEWKVKVKSLSCVWLFATPWTAAYQAPPSMGFSRQEYWSCHCLLQKKAERGRIWTWCLEKTFAFKLWWCWRRFLWVSWIARSSQSILMEI